MVYRCDYRVDIIIVPRYTTKKRVNKLQVYEVAIGRILEMYKSASEDTGKGNCDRLTGF